MKVNTNMMCVCLATNNIDYKKWVAQQVTYLIWCNVYILRPNSYVPPVSKKKNSYVPIVYPAKDEHEGIIASIGPK